MTLELLIAPPDPEGGAVVGTHVAHGLDGFVWTTAGHACSQCGEYTSWIDLVFESPLCPGACSQKAQDDYQWAELMIYLNSPEHRALMDSFRGGLFGMRCPNANCRPPSYCGLCNGTGQIP